MIISHWLFSFCLRNNTKPKQESFEFKAPQGPPPQPPTQVSPQVRKDGPVILSRHFIHTYVHFVPPSNTAAVYSPSHQLSTHIHICLFIRPSSCSGTQTSLLPLSLHASTIPPAHRPKGKQSTFLFIFFPCTSTCWRYQSPCIKESLFAFKVTPQSTVFTAELIWRCGDSSNR